MHPSNLNQSEAKVHKRSDRVGNLLTRLCSSSSNGITLHLLSHPERSIVLIEIPQHKNQPIHLPSPQARVLHLAMKRPQEVFIPRKSLQVEDPGLGVSTPNTQSESHHPNMEEESRLVDLPRITPNPCCSSQLFQLGLLNSQILIKLM